MNKLIIKTFLLSMVVFGIIACSDEETMITSCKLIEVNNVNGEVINTYEYDAQDDLLRIVPGKNLDNFEFEYLDGKVSKVTRKVLSVPPSDSCFIDLYEYNDQGDLIKIRHQYSGNVNCQNDSLFAITDYIYDNNGLLESTIMNAITLHNTYNKILTTYDGNGNLTRRERFINNTLNFLSTYKYDDQVNPLQGYLDHGKNNCIEEYNLIETEEREITFFYTYEYNELGIPIKETQRNSLDVSTRVYNYELSCE